MKKLNELKKISQLQFNYLRNKIHEQKEYLMKRLKLWKRRTKQYLELKNSTSEMKVALEALEIEQTI